MRIREAADRLKQMLSSIYDSRESAVITQWVTEKITGFSRSALLLHKEDALNLQQVEEFERMSAELAKHRPVQYVLHEAWFAGMKFYVDERVLIPRPETEELVEKVRKEVRSTKYEVRSEEEVIRQKSKVKSEEEEVRGTKYELRSEEEVKSVEGEGLNILDIGTGSGCIPIALKKKMPGADIWAIDVSDDALEVARMNAKNLGAEIQFRKINILREEERDQLGVFDIIVSNPPYVPESDRAEMSDHVVGYEPHLALFVPDSDPLMFYRGIIRFAKHHLSGNGKLFFEIHEKAAAGVIDLLHQSRFQDIMLHKDLQSRDRMVTARRGD